MRKRSSWASGSGNVPSYSMGFCVAMTMNGAGSWRVTPSTVIWCSSIASRSADCVFGVARLISSASTICADERAGAELEVAGALVVDGDAGDVGGQDVRRELDALERAAGRAREASASVVLPTPGTSSMRRWPWHIRQTSARRTSDVLPMMTFSTFARIRSAMILGSSTKHAPTVELCSPGVVWRCARQNSENYRAADKALRLVRRNYSKARGSA